MSIVTAGTGEPQVALPPRTAATAESAKAVALRWTARQLGASTVALVSSVPSRLIQGAVLGPSGYGLVVLAALVSTYAGYADLGMRYVLTRQIPLASGEGAAREVQELKTVVYSWMTLVSIVAVAVLWAMFAAGITLSGLLTLPHVVLISLLILAERANAYLHNLTKAIGEFDWVGQATSRIAILTPFLVVTGVVAAQVTGFLAAQLALQAYQFGFYWQRLRRVGRVFPPLGLPRAVLRRCFGVGVALWAINLSQSIFWTMETTVLAGFTDTATVGRYAFAVTVLNLAINLGGPFNNVAARQMLVERAGADEGDTEFLQKYLQRPLVLYLLVVSVALGVAYFVYAAVVRIYLPEFTASIPVAKVLVFGHMLFATTYFTGAILNVDALFGRRLMLLWICLSLNAALDVALLWAGYGILGVAWGSAASYAVYSLLMLAASSRVAFQRIVPGVALWARLAAVSVVLAAALQGLDGWAFGPAAQPLDWRGVAGDLALASLKVAVYVAAAITLYVVVFRGYRVFDELQRSVKYLVTLVSGRLAPAGHRS